jgi:hypothetical protein
MMRSGALPYERLQLARATFGHRSRSCSANSYGFYMARTFPRRFAPRLTLSFALTTRRDRVEVQVDASPRWRAMSV